MANPLALGARICEFESRHSDAHVATAWFTALG